MPNDVPDFSTAVNVVGGSVSITGTATVSISGTPTVQFAAGQSVSISGTPAVTIASGSVTIANASIAVINASGTKITSSRPPADFGQGTFVSNPNPTTYNVTVPADIQALVVELPNPLSKYVHLKIKFHYGLSDSAYVPLELFSFQQQVYVIPLMFHTYGENQGVQNTIDITLQATDLLGVVNVYALFEPNPLWLEFFAPPFAAPNQLPLMAGIDLGGTALVQFASQWLITPVANVQISLFEVIQGFAQQGAAPMAYIIGHGTALPANTGNAPMASRLALGSDAAAISHDFTFEFHGAQLPRGDGVWLQNPQAANLQVALFTINYSLS